MKLGCGANLWGGLLLSHCQLRLKDSEDDHGDISEREHEEDEENGKERETEEDSRKERMWRKENLFNSRIRNFL